MYMGIFTQNFCIVKEVSEHAKYKLSTIAALAEHRTRKSMMYTFDQFLFSSISFFQKRIKEKILKILVYFVFSWESVVGHTPVKQALEECVLYPLRQPYNIIVG